MIDIKLLGISGIEQAIKGMRNPMNSWDKSDSFYCGEREQCEGCPKFVFADDYIVGNNDLDLMKRLAKAGEEHAKYRRMINVYVDIKAPLYWWKEFDTYKVGTVANSCSTMHTIAAKPFELSDFSTEHLMGEDNNKNYMLRAQIEDHFYDDKVCFPLDLMSVTIDMLNQCRTAYRATEDQDLKKQYWWQMIQLLPSSYNQLRTVMLNYEVLSKIYKQRKNHKLDEWVNFCKWIECLPCAWGVIFDKE